MEPYEADFLQAHTRYVTGLNPVAATNFASNLSNWQN
jgi:hypothetical protein